MRLDLHVHSTYSSDGRATPKEILKGAKRIGLDGICITDHNTLKGSVEAQGMAKDSGLIVLRGMEISTSEGHVLAYGIDTPVEKGMTAAETVDRIRELGGLAVVSHPYKWWSGLGGSLTERVRPDALETLNGCSTKGHNAMALKLCRKMGLPQTAGSDAHSLRYIGRAYVLMDVPAESEEDVIEAIRAHKTRTGGTDRTKRESVSFGVKSFFKWTGRGFKTV